MSFPIVGPFSLHYFGSGKGNIRDKIPLNEWWRKKKSVVEQEYLSAQTVVWYQRSKETKQCLSVTDKTQDNSQFRQNVHFGYFPNVCYSV